MIEGSMKIHKHWFAYLVIIAVKLEMQMVNITVNLATVILEDF